MLQWRSKHAVLILLVACTAVIASVDGVWGWLEVWGW